MIRIKKVDDLKEAGIDKSQVQPINNKKELEEFISALEKIYPPTLWDRIMMPFRSLRVRMQNLWYSMRYALQRALYGYDERDLWSLYSYFIDRYKKVLTRLRDEHCGHPLNMTDEEYTNILNEMLYHLERMGEDRLMELYPDMPYEEIMKKIVEHKNVFFELFSEHFYDLWD